MGISIMEKKLIESCTRELGGVFTELLPYPLEKVKVYDGDEEEMYAIPEDAEVRSKLLDSLFFLFDKPSCDDVRFCLHSERKFRAGDFKVVRWKGLNILVSPDYAEYGGTILDWQLEGKQLGDGTYIAEADTGGGTRALCLTYADRKSE